MNNMKPLLVILVLSLACCASKSKPLMLAEGLEGDKPDPPREYKQIGTCKTLWILWLLWLE